MTSEIWTEQKLSTLLTTPSPALINDIKRLDGDLMIIGAGGKMGPTLSILAANAVKAAGIKKRIIAVSRFSNPQAKKVLNDAGIETISADMLEAHAADSLPDCENIIYMIGRKFGTAGQEALTWASNAWLPSRIAERFRNSRITVFSTGNVYPQTPVWFGGATEETAPAPIGEYAMSSLARERMFEYAAQKYGTRVSIFRLNYAVDLRYGVLSDIARRVYKGEALSVAMPCFNCIWQGDAVEIAIRCLLYADKKVFRLNVTGPETVSVRETAKKFGKIFGREPVLTDEEGTVALLNNAGKMFRIFGYPRVSLETMIDWQAQWILNGGRELGKPTHFEERKGNY